MERYDVVILGSGLGGLECGAILSREGYSVCVLEKNPVIGGCLQTFQRHGHRLDTGIHYIGSMDDGQILNQYFRYFGVRDALALRRMDEDAFDTVMLGGRGYEIGMGYDRFAANLAQAFPAEAANIERYCDLLRSVGGTMSVEKLRRGMISDDSMKYLELPAGSTIDAMFGDSTLRNVLGGTSALYAGVREKTTLYHYGMINHSFIESSYRFVNGSQQLADALADRIRANGGRVLTGREVTSIRVCDGRVSAVEVGGGEVFGGRHVISNIHPAVTFGLIEKTPLIKKATMTRLQSLENSYGIFSVYMVMKRGSVAYRNRNFYIYGDGDTWQTEYDTRRDVPRMVLLNMQAAGQEQEHATVVSLLCPVPMGMFGRWEDTRAGRRGGDYAEFKERLAERVIDFVAGYFPELRANAEHIYTTSPLSYRDYTATPGGSAYGIVKDYRSPLTTLVSVNTRVENLLLTGQNMNVHGALGVTVTAALTCSRLLGAEYLAKKIGNA